MRYKIKIKGTSDIIMHSLLGQLETTSEINKEKLALYSKKGSNRTVVEESRIKELECLSSVWWNDDCSSPVIPAAALRANLEGSAKKLRQGAMVREGLLVEADGDFKYDKKACGGSYADIAKKAQFTVPVRVQQARVLRTRAKFSDWSCTFTIEVDPELIDKEHVAEWLNIGGRRLGIGDWRPQTSGLHGRFEVVSLEEIMD